MQTLTELPTTTLITAKAAAIRFTSARLNRLVNALSSTSLTVVGVEH